MTLVKDQMAAPRVVLRPHATAVARAASSESRPTVSVAALRSPKTAHPVSAPRCAAPRGAKSAPARTTTVPSMSLTCQLLSSIAPLCAAKLPSGPWPDFVAKPNPQPFVGSQGLPRSMAAISGTVSLWPTTTRPGTSTAAVSTSPWRPRGVPSSTVIACNHQRGATPSTWHFPSPVWVPMCNCCTGGKSRVSTGKRG